LEDAGIKLDGVAADVIGKSGRDMLDALVAGTTDPDLLADVARRQMRRKIRQLREALEGYFDAHHAVWVGAILAHIDFLDEQIDRLADAIEEQIRPFAQAVELLCTVVGIQRRLANCILAEIGADVTRFASPRPTATPNARPSASSNSSNASDTTSRSRRPRQPERAFPAGQIRWRASSSRPRLLQVVQTGRVIAAGRRARSECESSVRDARTSAPPPVGSVAAGIPG
jgi:transposase